MCARLGKASLKLTDVEKKEVSRLAEISKNFFICRRQKFIDGAGWRAVLHSFQGDGTRHKTTKAVVKTNLIGDKKFVRRRMKEGAEYVVQRSFF